MNGTWTEVSLTKAIIVHTLYSHFFCTAHVNQLTYRAKAQCVELEYTDVGHSEHELPLCV